MRKLVACLACRNKGTRLYGKPLQNLDIDKRITVIDYMIMSIKGFTCISDIVLAISEGDENLAFIEIANKHGIKYIIGDEDDVLKRLIDACIYTNGTDIFRVTTESPFIYFEPIEKAWVSHINGDFDLTTLDHLPDGSGFEITKIEAYIKSWNLGEKKHRSELCSLYIREHKSDFKIGYVEIPKEIKRTDIRLTIDYPEDLILCRAVFKNFKKSMPNIPLSEIISFIDANPNLKSLTDPLVEEGLKTMYI
jgi:spore coat polysaccharide biosynthesis protein SpsF